MENLERVWYVLLHINFEEINKHIRKCVKNLLEKVIDKITIIFHIIAGEEQAASPEKEATPEEAEQQQEQAGAPEQKTEENKGPNEPPPKVIDSALAMLDGSIGKTDLFDFILIKA